MICSANSERQINAITEEIIDKEEENKYEVKRIEGKEGGKWVLFSMRQNEVSIIWKNYGQMLR